MRKLTLLLLRAFLAPFAVTLPVALFILDMQFLWVYADDLIGKGLEPWIIGKLMVYASARLVNMALPLAILVASIMAMGSLAERNELTAMKSSGLSLWRIFRPLMWTMVIIAVGAFSFSNSVWPAANLKFRALLFSVTKKKPTLNLQPGLFYTGIEGFAIRVQAKDDDGTLHDILIHDNREASLGATRVIRAKKGRMDQHGDYLMLDLEDGYNYEEDLEQAKRRQERLHPFIASEFRQQTLAIDLGSLDFNQVDEGLFQRVHEMMTISQLEQAMDSLDGVAQSRRTDVARYGERNLLLMRDSMRLDSGRVIPAAVANGPGIALGGFVAPQRRMAFDAARELSRNAKQGVENALDDAASKQRLKNRHAVEWHRKFFLASSCILLFFIGAPLGAIIRKGGLGMPTIIAICIFLAYYIISIVGEQMIKSGTLEAPYGMWLSTMILLPVAAWLTRMAMRDAHIRRINLGRLSRFKNYLTR